MAASVVRSSPAPGLGDTSAPTAGPSSYATPQAAAAKAGNMNGSVGGATATGTGRQSSPVNGVTQPMLHGAQQAKTLAIPNPPAPAPAAPTVSARSGGPIDMRAEEDAARRLNVSRVVGNSKYAGSEARGKKTDLCGPEFKIRMDIRAKNHQTTIDDEALAYLSMAAETQLRQLLASSISAQQHRTTTSFLHPPPLTPAASSSRTKPKPMWDVSIHSDPNAVMEALNRQAKDAEREFRTSRMSRIAKEHEMERIRERQMALAGGGSEGGHATTPQQRQSPDTPDDNPSPGASASGSGQPPASPDRPGSAAGTTSTPASASAAPSTPLFGGGGPKKSTGSSSKSGKKNAKDVSSDVQIKMSNATAMRSAGMGKKYSWMSSAPSISSPLSGNKKKGKKGAVGKSQLGADPSGGAGEDEDAEGEADDQDLPGAAAGAAAGRKRSKTQKGEGGSGGGRSKRRRMPTMPTRRPVLVDTPGPGPEVKDREKFVPDDRCLTVNDLVFALERDKSGGQGMGTSDEVVRRVMARPGGPWGPAAY